MPYIEKKYRPAMNEIVKLMKENNVEARGDLNYVLFAFCKRHIVPSYDEYKNFCGELRQCATEIERRILAPYEDKMILKNGDV